MNESELRHFVQTAADCTESTSTSVLRYDAMISWFVVRSILIIILLSLSLYVLLINECLHTDTHTHTHVASAYLAQTS